LLHIFSLGATEEATQVEAGSLMEPMEEFGESLPVPSLAPQDQELIAKEVLRRGIRVDHRLLWFTLFLK
jgi:hypothetical protein